MPGMNSGLSSTNATIVSAFHAALLHQWFFVLIVLALLALSWNLLRSLQLRRLASSERPATVPRNANTEAPARRLLRCAFGGLWILDGILQGQSAMPLGIPVDVIEPTASTSPPWVQHLVNLGTTVWSNHPVTASTAAVWIQVGIGAFLLVAPRGTWSRMAGGSSALWGAIVWVFGESFGGIFAPGLSWLFGAPGAALLYVVAGLLVALPERVWTTPRAGRFLLGASGLYAIGMAVLQAWPGRGFWQGGLGPHGTGADIAVMARAMAHTPQPRLFSALVADFGAFDVRHGFAVNLVVVVALAAIGGALVVGRPPFVRAAVVAASALCLADWVVVEDLGFFGGVGTDPNSMIPTITILVAAYLAATRPAVTDDTVVPLPLANADRAGLLGRLTADPTLAFRSLAAIGAAAVILLGAAPMALASTDPNADPIVSEALDGLPVATDAPAPPFSLVDQHGRVLSLADLRHKVVALTFLDPVCVSDCPLIAQEFREADQLLGGAANRVELVAVVINPLYRNRTYTNAFDIDEGLDHVSNWHFLTGTLPELQAVWQEYGVGVEPSTGGSMVAHNDIAYVIGTSGRTRFILNTDPGPGTSTTKSATAVVLANTIRSVLG